MKKIYDDSGYCGELVDKVKNKLDYQMGITLRSGKSTAFKLLPKRCVWTSYLYPHKWLIDKL